MEPTSVSFPASSSGASPCCWWSSQRNPMVQPFIDECWDSDPTTPLIVGPHEFAWVITLNFGGFPLRNQLFFVPQCHHFWNHSMVQCLKPVIVEGALVLLLQSSDSSKWVFLKRQVPPNHPLEIIYRYQTQHFWGSQSLASAPSRSKNRGAAIRFTGPRGRRTTRVPLWPLGGRADQWRCRNHHPNHPRL